MQDRNSVKRMSREIQLLRLSYWIGAIIDAIVGVLMIVPAMFGLKEGIVNFSPGPDYVFAMGMGSSLMFGWTILFLWADRKPVERKGILPITVFPVIVGIFVSRLYGISSGFLTLTYSIPDLIIPIFLCVLFLWSYYYSSNSFSNLE
jgi:hypothetical protein